MPSTRARTWATRNAEVRPGNSVVSETAARRTVTTATSGGCGAGGAALPVHPARSPAASSARPTTVLVMLVIVRFMESYASLDCLTSLASESPNQKTGLQRRPRQQCAAFAGDVLAGGSLLAPG